MLKVLIVDDDIVVRTNLKTLIDWNKNGFEIHGEAANGSDAIQKLEKDTYHIVITDMSMPIIDGIALIEYIKEKYQTAKVIALSGYNDFNYVRQSLKKGAVDYILKHNLDENVLLNVLKAAREAIWEEQEDGELRQKLKEQLYQSRPVLAQRFISRLIKGSITNQNEISQTIEALQMKLGMRNLVVITCEIDGFFMLNEQNTDILTQSFLNISEEILKDFGDAEIAYINDGRFVIIAHLGSNYSSMLARNRLIEMIDRIKSSIKRYLSITVSFGISNVCENICDITKYYLEAEKALNNKFYAGKDRILWSTNIQSTKAAFVILDIKEENKIVDYLKHAERNEVMDYLEVIFNRVLSSNASCKSVQIVCAELYNIAHKTAKEFGVEYTFSSIGTQTSYEILKRFDTVQEIKQWVIDNYEKLIALIESSKVSESFSIYSKKAIEFINKNYQKSISLADAAEYIGVSSQYLSTVFKDDCKMGFVDYLNNVRMEHAKRLIVSGNDKLKEIVEKVGFNTYNYFFKVFKEFTGMTPADYEKVYKR